MELWVFSPRNGRWRVRLNLVLLCWQIGHDILDRPERENWGAKVIDRLAADLKRTFPDMKGFSPRNLKYMRRSRQPGRTKQLCKRCLHRSPCITISRSWKNFRSRGPYLVRQNVHSERLEPQRPGSQDRTRATAPAGKSRRQLRPNAARAEIRPYAGHHQRSLQLRFSHPRRRCARARSGARPARPPAPISSRTRRWVRVCRRQYQLAVGEQESTSISFSTT